MIDSSEHSHYISKIRRLEQAALYEYAGGINHEKHRETCAKNRKKRKSKK